MGKVLCDAGRFFCGELLTGMIKWEMEISARRSYEITVCDMAIKRDICLNKSISKKHNGLDGHLLICKVLCAV